MLSLRSRAHPISRSPISFTKSLTLIFFHFSIPISRSHIWISSSLCTQIFRLWRMANSSASYRPLTIQLSTSLSMYTYRLFTISMEIVHTSAGIFNRGSIIVYSHLIRAPWVSSAPSQDQEISPSTT